MEPAYAGLPRGRRLEPAAACALWLAREFTAAYGHDAVSGGWLARARACSAEAGDVPRTGLARVESGGTRRRPTGDASIRRGGAGGRPATRATPISRRRADPRGLRDVASGLGRGGHGEGRRGARRRDRRRGAEPGDDRRRDLRRDRGVRARGRLAAHRAVGSGGRGVDHLARRRGRARVLLRLLFRDVHRVGAVGGGRRDARRRGSARCRRRTSRRGASIQRPSWPSSASRRGGSRRRASCSRVRGAPRVDPCARRPVPRERRDRDGGREPAPASQRDRRRQRARRALPVPARRGPARPGRPRSGAAGRGRLEGVAEASSLPRIEAMARFARGRVAAPAATPRRRSPRGGDLRLLVPADAARRGAGPVRARPSARRVQPDVAVGEARTALAEFERLARPREADARRPSSASAGWPAGPGPKGLDRSAVASARCSRSSARGSRTPRSRRACSSARRRRGTT